MEITEEKTEKALLIHLSGRLDASTAEHCREKLMSFNKDNTLPLILNFTDTQYISSMGLRVLITLGQDMKTKGQPLSLVCPSGLTLEIFKTAGFNLIFTIHETKEAALEAIK